MGRDARPELFPGTLELLVLSCCKLTAAGRKQMAVERGEFDRVICAIHKAVNAT